MNIGDLLNKLNWLIRLLIGEYAKILAAIMAWQSGIPVDVFFQFQNVRLHVAAQQGGNLPPNVRRRLIIDELQ